MHIAAQQGVIVPPPPTQDTNEEPLEAANVVLGVRNSHQFILSMPQFIIVLILGILIGIVLSRLSSIMP